MDVIDKTACYGGFMTREKNLEKHFETLQTIPMESIEAYLKEYEKEDCFVDLLNFVCNGLTDIIQRSYLKYDKNATDNDDVVKIFINVANMIKTDELAYYVALSEFFKGNNQNVFKYLKIAAETGFFYSENNIMTDEEFSGCFVAPFKGGYSKTFYNEVHNLLSEIKTEKRVLDLCKAMPVFYYAERVEEIQETFENIIEVYPDCIIAKEILAINYYNSKMWGNAVALFEQLDNGYYILFEADLYFYMAWCYGKLKEVNNEIEYYKKSIELFPEAENAINNLGYAYYKAKQYNKALECFKTCIDNNWEVKKYAANNYVRTLLAMKRYIDAKEFVKKSPSKIAKSLVEKVKSASRTNKRTSTDVPLETNDETAFTAIEEKEIDVGAKKYQFTSEKILEDELVLRIEMGLEVFGKKLKIFRRKGVYGRQYILSNGKRPDILAEDADGNLYVIELKKR